MLQNIKPLLVVLLVLGTCVWSFHKWMCPALIRKDHLKSLALGWAGISLALFLSPNYWVFAFVTFVLVFWLGQSTHPAVLFFGFIYASPYLERLLPGVGGINELLSLSYPRVLALTCLVLWLNKWQPPIKDRGKDSSLFDQVVLVYGIFNMVLQFMSDTMTNTLRVYSYFLMDTMLVYWIARRWIAQREVMTEALIAYLFGLSVVCLIAAVEFAKGWLLYANLADTLKAFGTAGSYLARGETGLIRANATTGHSIPMGYVAMVGILIWLGLSELKQVSLKVKALGLLVLAAGSIASLSRGPWVALAAGLVLWYSMSPQGLKRLATAAATLGVLFGVALLTPARDEIISVIPWVGTADTSNIDYRQRLIQVSMFLISESPWFGTPTFMSAPIMQQLIQGQGIIDLVNTYVALALASGMVGVTLFSAIVIGPLFKGVPVYLGLLSRARALKRPELADPMLRACLCVLLSSAIAIGTVSSITVIPWTYWLMAGLAVNLIQHHSGARRAAPSPVPPRTHV